MLKQLWAAYLKKIQKRYRQFISRLHNHAVVRKWHKAGYPYPAPHEYKQELIKQYATKYSLDTFIETGTDQGKMPEALQDVFAQIYSIELNLDHYLNAKEKFHFTDHIEIVRGDSGLQLTTILAEIRKPVLIWLDTHATLEKGRAEVAVLNELKAILQTKPDHVILINDARLLTGEKGYPSLIEVRNFIASIRPDYRFEVENDVVRVERGN